MKILLPTYHLNTLSNNKLENISSDEVAGIFKDIHYSGFQRRPRINVGYNSQMRSSFYYRSCLTPSINQWSTHTRRQKKPKSKSNKFRVPVTPFRQSFNDYYKKKERGEIVQDLCPSLHDHNYLSSSGSASRNNVKLINLSYSQPSTPNLRYQQPSSFPCQTPIVINKNDCSLGPRNFCLPITPMLNDPLKTLIQPVTDTGNNSSLESNFLDILQMIDDDTSSVELVERKINQYSDVSIGDHNVADYLLDFSEDYAPKPPVIQRPQFEIIDNQQCDSKRKCKRAKPVCFEESENYMREKKKKDQERRKRKKESFQNPTTGLRRSSRVTRRKVSYTAELNTSRC